MLQSMRELSKSWAFKGLMAFLLVSFSIWGIGDIFRGNFLRRAVAKIGSVAISVQELEYEFQKSMKEARQVLGPDLTTQQARQMGLLDRALNVLIEKAGIDQDVKRLGLVVDPKTILSQLAAEPQFRDKDGKFNRQLWESLLRQNGMSEAQFLNEEAQQQARRMIFSAVAANAMTPKTVLDNLYRARGQKRILDVLTIANAGFSDPATPDEAALKAYHEANGPRFTAPEYRAISVAKLASTDIIKETNVSDDDLRQAFEARQAEFSQPEQRDLVQVVLQDEEKAKAIAEEAQKEGDLSKAAKNKGYSAVGIDRSEQKTAALPELYNAVFALKERGTSSPIKTAMGWHVVQVKKVYPARTPSFEEVKATLRLQLQNEMATESITRIVNQLDDALAGGSSLEDMADSFKLRLIKVPAVDAKGLTPEEKTPNELPAKNDVLKTAFGQGAGETSAIIEERTAQGSDYVIVRTDEVTQSQVRPFEEVKDQVVLAWRKDEQVKIAGQEAEKIASALRDGKSMSDLPLKKGLELRTSKPISLLGEIDKDLPKDAFLKILKMKKGDVITAADAEKNYVLRLASLVDVDPAKADDKRSRVVEALAEEAPYDLLDQYGKELRKTFPVKINEELFETLKKREN